MNKEPQNIRVAITTLGCKVNQCESAALAEKLQAENFFLVPFAAAADYYLINTCTVTSFSDFQARQLIRRARRANPQAEIIVTGCYAQRAPEELAALDNTGFIIGNDCKHKIVDILRKNDASKCRIAVGDIARQKEFINMPAKMFRDRTRGFLKIQDGCNSFCSYCIVPYARGRSRSLPPLDVILALNDLADNNYKEVVLTGIHLGVYGRDLNPPLNLTDLLKRLIAQNSMVRIRLSSIEPREINDELLSILKNNDNFCPHLHIPLQSGDDTILKLMGRDYDTGFYRGILEKTLVKMNDAAIGADVMVGFPGEGEKEFQNTLRLLQDLPIAYLHVFPYSERPQTEAIKLPGKVPAAVKKERAAILRDVGMKKRSEFARRFLGKKLNVLIEQAPDRKTGLSKGFSQNYLSVLIAEGKAPTNQVMTVDIIDFQDGKLYGKLDNE